MDTCIDVQEISQTVTGIEFITQENSNSTGTEIQGILSRIKELEAQVKEYKCKVDTLQKQLIQSGNDDNDKNWKRQHFFNRYIEKEINNVSDFCLNMQLVAQSNLAIVQPVPLTKYINNDPAAQEQEHSSLSFDNIKNTYAIYLRMN